MKRRLAALLACVLVVSALTACGEENSKTGTLAEATITPSAEIVETGDALLSDLPLEEYVTLCDYKALEISVTPKTELTGEMLGEYVQSYFYNDASYYLTAESFLKEGTVKEGDAALIDYVGKKDGVAFEGGTATDFILGIGSGSFIDGFEEGLVGVKVGETVDLNLTFPKSYQNADLAGQEVVFTVTVKGLVSLNDTTVANMGIQGISTVADYKAAIMNYLYNQIDNEYYSNLCSAVITSLVENNTVSKLPSNIYEKRRTNIIDSVSSEASYYEMDADSYTQLYTGMNLADYAITTAESTAKQAVIFQAIANVENITVTDEEIDAFVEEYIAYNGIESVEAFYEYSTREEVRIAVISQKVVDFVGENAKIVDTE